MELIKGAKSSKQKQRDEASESESETETGYKEKHRSKSKKKESKAVAKYKSSRTHEESESESESDRPKQRKNKSAKDKSKALVKAGNSRKHKESDLESSNEEIVEKRKRYEEINFHELPHPYVMTIANIWEVTPNKVEGWCDNHNLIRLDTKDGSINLDKLIKKEPLEAGNERDLASFQKRETRWIAENPGGYMATIPRFNKGHQGGPNRRRPDVIVVDRVPVISINPWPQPVPHGHYYDARCMYCVIQGKYCDNLFHARSVEDWILQHGGHRMP